MNTMASRVKSLWQGTCFATVLMLVLLAFNHVFAALEAYVGAHLADFPGDLKIRAMPGGVGASLTVPVQVR